MITTAMIYSSKEMEEVEILKRTSNKDIIVKTKKGVICKAIYNPISGVIYADDKYEIITITK